MSHEPQDQDKLVRDREYYRQLGIRGGFATLKKYGPEHYRKLGLKGGPMHSSEQFSAMGLVGGKVTMERYGKEHYQEMGRKGAETAKKNRRNKSA